MRYSTYLTLGLAARTMQSNTLYLEILWKCAPSYVRFKLIVAVGKVQRKRDQKSWIKAGFGRNQKYIVSTFNPARIPKQIEHCIKVHLNFRDQSGSAGKGKSSDSFNVLFYLLAIFRAPTCRFVPISAAQEIRLMMIFLTHTPTAPLAKAAITLFSSIFK